MLVGKTVASANKSGPAGDEEEKDDDDNEAEEK
jgi:hypothetical protein